MGINWKSRLRNKTFLVSLLSLLLILSNQVAGAFGYDITVINAEVTKISETVLMILSLLGIIIDPTTQGVTDKEVK